MIKRLESLLEVKSIITLALTFTACWGFVTSKLTPELFATWVGMVFVYYFQRKQSA